eukprot:gb/GECG01000197.1/.p1 GENE.gb/GECG01000197.1/~~gb/GECG01000197.1/.p1  ORF type:complete len:596 (+),score=104.58 gb/GECG01000197.1/:1-1788(+)
MADSDIPSKDKLAKWLLDEVRKWAPQTDPSTMADYVLELVRQQGTDSASEGRHQFLLNHLGEIMGDSTETFVNKLEDALDNETYLQRDTSRRDESRRSRSDRRSSGSRDRRRRSRSRSRSRDRDHRRRRSRSPRRGNESGRGGRGGRLNNRQRGFRNSGGDGTFFQQNKVPPEGALQYGIGQMQFQPPQHTGLLGSRPTGVRLDIAQGDGEPVDNPGGMKTIRVTRIPFQLCSIVALSQYFQKFGHIANMNLRDENGEAFVQFSDPDSATRAVNDRAPVCDEPSIVVRFARFELGSKRNKPRGGKHYQGPSRNQRGQYWNGQETTQEGDEYRDKSQPAASHLERELTPQERQTEFLRRQEEQEEQLNKMIQEQQEQFRRLREETLSKEEKQQLKKDLVEKSKVIQKKQVHLQNAFKTAKRAAEALRGEEPLSMPPGGHSEEEDNDVVFSHASARIQEEWKPMTSRNQSDESVEEVSAPETDKNTSIRENPSRASTVVDNRTTKVLVYLPADHDGEVDAKEDVVSALNDYGVAEVVGEDKETIIVDFKNRRAAERAVKDGATVAGQQLKIEWYDTRKRQKAEQQTTTAEEATVEEA